MLDVGLDLCRRDERKGVACSGVSGGVKRIIRPTLLHHH